MAVSQLDRTAAGPEGHNTTAASGIVEKSEIKLRSIVIGIVAAAVPLLLLFLYFRAFFTGLVAPEAMDLAQLGRNLMSRGFSTSIIRPIALEGGVLPAALPDTTHGPLYPFVLALAFGAYGASDSVVAGISALFYLLTIPVIYILGRRMFGHNVGLVAAMAVAVNSLMLEYAASGLNITLYIFLASLSLLTYHKIASAQARAKDGSGPGPTAGLLVQFGALAGLLYLAEPLFAFAAPFMLLAVAVLGGARRWRNLGIVTAALLVLTMPWMIRNGIVAGNPVLGGKSSELWMNTVSYPGTTGYRLDSSEVTGSLSLFKSVIRKVMLLTGSTVAIFPQVAGSWILAFFLPALLFRYSDAAANGTRRVLVWCFLGLVIAHVLFNASQTGTMAIFVSLVPVMLVFAVSYLVHLMGQARLSRGSHRFAVALIAFAVTYPLLSSMAFANFEDRMPGKSTAAELKRISAPTDVVLSDQPWLVAWHADRRAIWVPITNKTTQKMRDQVKELRWLFMTPSIASMSNDWRNLYSALLKWNQMYVVAERAKEAPPKPALLQAEGVPEPVTAFMRPLDGFATRPPVGKNIETILAALPPGQTETASN